MRLDTVCPLPAAEGFGPLAHLGGEFDQADSDALVELDQEVHITIGTPVAAEACRIIGDRQLLAQKRMV